MESARRADIVSDRTLRRTWDELRVILAKAYLVAEENTAMKL